MSDDPLSDDRSSPFSVESKNECNNIVLKHFIEAFERLPELWDVSNPHYKNKNKRNDGLERLLLIYKQLKPNASTYDVRKKINSLKSNFRKELKKIELSKHSSDVYKPTSWTYKKLLFLNSDDKNNRNCNPKKEPDITDPLENSSTSLSFTINSGDTLTPTEKKMTATIQTEAIKSCDLPQSNNQEIDPLALIWTQKLRNLNSTQRTLAEKAINDILFEAQFNNLRRDFVQIKARRGPSMYSYVRMPSPDESEH